MFKQHSRVSFCFRGLCDEWSRITKKSNFALRRLMFSFHSLTWFGSSQITQTRWRKILVAPVDWFIHFHNKQKCDLFFFFFFFLMWPHAQITLELWTKHWLPWKNVFSPTGWQWFLEVPGTKVCGLTRAFRNKSNFKLLPYSQWFANTVSTKFLIWQIFTPNTFP